MKKKTLFAAFAVCAALFLAGAVPVYAADETYAEIHGDTVTLMHELVVDKDATTVHDAKFTFSVAGSKVKTDDDPVYLVEGPKGVTVTESLTYSDADVAGASADENSGKKTVKKEIEVNFKNVKFTDVGIYRYEVKQSFVPGKYFIEDDHPTRYIDVSVTDDGDDRLKIASVIVRTTLDTDEANPDINATKSDRFTNFFTANTLTVSKRVSGNQSSKNKYFRFTVKLTKDTSSESGDPAAITDNTLVCRNQLSGDA